MTDNDRNTRTLVVCFVIAVMSLISLRFVEVKNVTTASGSQVLGETIQIEQKEVVLPNAEIETGVLETK